jgi:putative flippase GtrA
LIGISAVMLDLIVYYLLTVAFNVSIDISKALGFASGSVYTFFVNKSWTWNNKEKTSVMMFSRFMIIYGASLFINLAVNRLALFTIPEFEAFFQLKDNQMIERLSFHFKVDKFFAFFLATVASACWNFMGQKFWVFREKKG